MTGSADDATVLILAARLSAALIGEHAAVDAAGGRSLGCLAEASAFKRPLRLARARLAGLHTMSLGSGFMDRLRSSAASRASVLLISQPIAAVKETALLVASVALYRGLIGVVLKDDRERLRDEVGDEAFTIATQEAVLLYAPLGALDDGEPIWTVGEPGALRSRLVRIGAGILGRLVTLAEPALADTFARRMSADASCLANNAIAFDRSHCDHVLRLLRRRGRVWATLIA